MYALNLVALLGLHVTFCVCQNSSLVVNVTEVRSTDYLTLVCNIPPSTNSTRWTFLSGSTGTLLMSYQNGRCTVLLSDNIFSGRRYSYTCNSTIYQVTIYPYSSGGLNNHILACRDAVQPESTGSTWMIKTVSDGDQCNCDPTITFSIREITEGENVTFLYTRLTTWSGVEYVNWYILGSNTATMGIQNGQCTTQGTTFLDNASKYIFTCSIIQFALVDFYHQFYTVTILNIQRNEHNDIYMCTPFGQTEGTGLNWIIKVQAPVTSVTLTPSISPVNVIENTAVEFTCTTSTARPAASVYWYKHNNGQDNYNTQITDNITTSTDYNDLSVTTSILRFVPSRQDNASKIYCKANNSINTSPMSSERNLLNVMYKAESPYITEGNGYHVIENTPGSLSCTVKGGNPTPTVSWSCNKFSPTNQTTIHSDGNVTSTITWALSRTHGGICTCTSKQTGFIPKTIHLSLVVLYPPSKPLFSLYGSNADGDISFIEGNTRSITCISDSKPSPDRYMWTGPKIKDDIDIQTLTFINVKKEDAGQYTCSVHNTMNPSNGGSVAGVNSNTVNVDVLHPPKALYFVYDNENGQNITNKVLNVIQGDTFNIVCKSMDGNPSPIINWNRQTDKMPVLRVENIQESRTNATCTATNYMKETNRPVVHGNVSDKITFTFLVYPTIKLCEFYYNVNHTTNNIILRKDDIDTLMIMENESFTLKCSVDGKPTPTVSWNIPHRSLVSSSSVTINNLTREMKGDYVFTANSLLEPSFKSKYIATVSKTVSVNVLYPPAILPMNKIAKLKCEQFNLMCNYTTGMPEMTSIKWTRDIDNRVWNNAALHIETLENSDTGIYTCTAYNIMIRSGDNKSYIGQHNQSFHLDVQCTDIPSPIPVPLIGGIAGGVTGCIIIVVVIIFIIRRYSSSSKKSAEEQAEYNTGRVEDITLENNDATAYDEIVSVNNYEMVNLNTGESKPYSTLDQTQQHTTSDTTSGDNKAVYKNMKIQVI